MTELGILRQLVVNDCLVSIKLQAVRLWFDLERVGVREACEILVGVMHHVVVEEQITQHVEAFGFHALCWLTSEHFPNHLQTLDPDENSFGLEVLSTDEVADATQEALFYFRVGFLANTLNKFECAYPDRVILHLSIVLVCEAEHPRSNHPIFSVL